MEARIMPTATAEARMKNPLLMFPDAFLIEIALINVWNRVNVAVRQIARSYKG
jgi:hypothetical protein